MNNVVVSLLMKSRLVSDGRCSYTSLIMNWNRWERYWSFWHKLIEIIHRSYQKATLMYWNLNIHLKLIVGKNAHDKYIEKAINKQAAMRNIIKSNGVQLSKSISATSVQKISMLTLLKEFLLIYPLTNPVPDIWYRLMIICILAFTLLYTIRVEIRLKI